MCKALDLTANGLSAKASSPSPKLNAHFIKTGLPALEAAADRRRHGETGLPLKELDFATKSTRGSAYLRGFARGTPALILLTQNKFTDARGRRETSVHLCRIEQNAESPEIAHLKG